MMVPTAFSTSNTLSVFPPDQERREVKQEKGVHPVSI